MKFLGQFLLLILYSTTVFATTDFNLIKKHYDFLDDPIDVVIPCGHKDLETLERCIEGIQRNSNNIRRIIVISSQALTDKAEWFDERNYPFDKYSVALHLLDENEDMAKIYANGSRIGWYYQQLLKLYASFVIPDISSNVLILDSDTIFLNPTQFQNRQLGGLYNPGSEYNPEYFEHGKRLIPGFNKVYPHYSGISHHMLFQKSVLIDLFSTVENYHQTDFWKAFCHCVSKENLYRSGASEYELYFNFVFSQTDQVSIRKLLWTNSSKLSLLSQFQKEGYHFVAFHAWMRQ